MRTKGGVLLSAVLLLAGAGAAHAEDYLEDARTAAAVSFASPRAPLREGLRVLSEAVKVSLSVSPALAEEPVVGYVPQRPLRETMAALEELYDATWTALPGTPRGYRLDPDPGKAKAQASARADLLKRYAKALDDQYTALPAEVKAGKPVPEGQNKSLVLLLLLWKHLTPADRERVLGGVSVTIPIREALAQGIQPLAVSISRQSLSTIAEKPLTGPMLATFDMDDKDSGAPWLRVHVTGMRENSIVVAIGAADLVRLLPAPKLPEPPDAGPDAPSLPSDAGDSGRLSGTREDLIVKAGQLAGVPILSRHRAWGGTVTLFAGGRKVAQLVGDLAMQSDARAKVNARGFYLMRSTTELLDNVGTPPGNVIRAYLAGRPAPGSLVPFTKLAELGALTPLQLSVLERSNIATNEAGFARETFALLRFYRALSAAQRAALFSEPGLEVAPLTHHQLHELMDERAKRGDFNVYPQLQEIQGLRFRFREDLSKKENSLVLQALRGTEVMTASNLNLPEVEAEETPAAKR